MNRWQNPQALKRVKSEVEACAAKLGGALEAVINTPGDDHKNLVPLTAAATLFAPVPGTLRMLQFAHLALLAGEIQALLLDTLRTDVELDGRELDLRLEATFVAVTDLPALLEHALRESRDSFELVISLVNRLRKARGCALIFSANALLKNADVSFRKQFGSQTEKMQGLLAKQVAGLQKATLVLAKSPADMRALQVIATALDNLELMLRDHRNGGLWGLARALAEVYEHGACDRPALAACFKDLVPHAQKLLTGIDALDAGIDEAVFERLVSLVAGAGAVEGRPGIVKLWYKLNPVAGKHFRADYRNILVRYYNKGALAKGLTLVNDDCKHMLDNINALAEAADINRERVREIWQAIGKVGEVLSMLGMNWLRDLIAAKLPATPGEKLHDALSLAARLLFRISTELEQKLEKMDRELFSPDATPGAADGGNANRARVLQTAIEMLEAVTLAFDEHVAGAGGSEAQPGAASTHLRVAQAKLEAVTNVLDTLRCTEQSRHLAVARDYVAWLLQAGETGAGETGVRVNLTPTPISSAGDRHRMLAHLLICSLRNLEQLLFGRDDAAAASLERVAVHAQALRGFLDFEAPAAPPPVARIALVASPIAAPANAGPEAETEAETETEAEAEAEAKLVAESLPEEPAATADDDINAVFAEEFDEVFAQLCEDHAALARDSTLVATATDCRRHFHTLKGSGRMVGAERISRLAESMEKAFDVACTRGIDPALLELTGRVLGILPALKQAFRTGDDATGSPDVVDNLCGEVGAWLGRCPTQVENAEPRAEVARPAARVVEARAHTAVRADVTEQAPAVAAKPERPVEAPPVRAQPEAADPALLSVFLDEADELLQSLDKLYLQWRQSPSDKACVDEYLRILHTIKGSAALVGEHDLSTRAHEYETFIVDMRQRKLDFDGPFFAACDARLHALHDVNRCQSQIDSDTDLQQQAPDEHIRVSSQLLKSLLNDADEASFSRSRVETAFQEISALLLDMDTSLNRFNSCVKALDDRAGQPLAQFTRAEHRQGFAERNARHNDEFDALEMDRYTELQELAVSLAENYNDLQDVRASLGVKARDIAHILDGQQRLTNSLQDGLILTQMVPFASVVPRLSRLVRQIGTTLRKPVRLEVTNQQGSLDRNILQAIVTPLEHIVRNAIDHGIEAADIRKQHGKPEEATLRITVARRGASFRIEIRDDGQGIDVDKVRQQAQHKGLLQADAVITEQEAHALLFRSGFSTAATVSNISGRGVGLDVVKSEIEQIGGTVEIESERGKGTALILNLPLTSSLNRALVFAVQDTRYAVLMNTLDGVLVEKLASVHQKQQQEGKPVFDYVGKRYEYLYLGKLIDPDFKPRLESIDSPISLLLVSGASANYALHIDAIVESRDLVVKSLGQQFASMPGIAGGVILPDGNVAIVLDLKSMLAVQGKDVPASDVPLTLMSAKRKADKARKLVMVVDDSVTVRKVTSAMLKRNGMDVITARNGLEAVELLENNLPDLILLDIEMPRMDGFEVAAFVRSQEGPVCDIPIIMITSRIGEKHRNRAEAIGVNEYLCKPFKEDSLMQSIRAY